MTTSSATKPIVFENLLMLAPLAGYTDLPFRSVVKKFGVDITVSEMISSHALVYANKKTLKMVEKSPIESPYAVQIAGSKPEVVRAAVEILNAQEGIDIIDLNCGCPAPKVANHGNGSGLLKDLSLLVRIANLIKQTSTKPYLSLKLRLGFDKKIPLEIAAALNDCDVDYVVIHGRTRSHMYNGEADWTLIGEVKANPRISIPIIGNGDITSPEKLAEYYQRYGVDGIMVGRAAIGAPWIFREMKYFLRHGHRMPEIPAKEKMSLLRRQIDESIGRIDEYRGILHIRRHLAASPLFKGIPDFRATRIAMLQAKTRNELENVLEKIEKEYLHI